MGSAFACRKHQISRQVLHKWVQIFNARAEIIFQHGSTLRAQRHDQEKIEKLTDRVIDLERKVNESGPTELAGDEGPENQNEYEWADIAPIPPRGLK